MNAKRIFDFGCSLLLLAAFSPVMLVVAVGVLLSMGSPVLFRQQRPGLHGQQFFIYKYRTMTDSTDDSGQLLPANLRLTPFGAFLRRFSLDELPQLFNVLKGELSLVGPRPLLMEYLPLYSSEQARRHDVKPGITGWAQINGRNNIEWEEKFRLDVWYVDHYSFMLDLKILFRTVLIAFRREGIDQNEKVIGMEPFRGSKTS